MLGTSERLAIAREAEGRLKELLRSGRKIEADLLVELNRFESRRLYEALGSRSFWDFLTKRLGLLECAAFHRMHASRLVGAFPSALERLRDGRLCPTILVELREVLNASNAETLFDEVVGKSRKDVKEIAISLQATPEPTPPPGGESRRTYTVRKAPPPVAKPASEADLTLRRRLFLDPVTVPAPAASAESSTPVIPEPPTPAPIVLVVPSRERKTDIRALGEDLYDVSMRVGGRFVELLAEARIAEGHAVPDGDLETLLIRGLELLIERSGKKSGKIPVNSNQRTENPAQNPGAKYVSSSLYRQVMVRDGHRCQWELPDGGRCQSRERVEPDHIEPLALGGKSELSNLRVLCHEHNAQAARERLGEDFVAAKIREAQAKRWAHANGATRSENGEVVSGRVTAKPPPEGRPQGP